MTDPSIHALLVEDEDGYAALIAAQLQATGDPITLCRVTSLHAAQAALADTHFDAILLDLNLPDSTDIETVDRVKALAPDVPIVVITARDDRTSALQSMQHGAEDYLVKGSTDANGLSRSIRYARERAGLRRELRVREARFRALVDQSLDAVTLMDANLISLYNSRSVERVSGYSPQELKGQRLDRFGHPEDLPQIMRAFAECLANPGRAISLSYRYLHKDGSWHWGEGVVVNRLDDPAVQAIVMNHRDITARKLAEQALRLSEEKLRQAYKMEAVGRLAGGVAHDFNNVLTAIFGYTELLSDQLGPDDPRRADLEQIRRAADRAATLTRQLLAFSRKQVMQPRSLDLNAVVSGMETLLARLVGENVTVEIRPASDLWRVLADPGQLEQVLMNLAANARDAMPDGGRFTIRTANVEMSPDDVAGLPGLQPGAYVMLDVSDTGQGIPSAIQNQVFEPFFTTKELGKGTGLGLATVYGIVKQTGGGIYLTSEESKGTRFAIYLPRVPPP
jgi:two-component system, cell cycle sensor histidine kinase and response regulator CckA